MVAWIFFRAKNVTYGCFFIKKMITGLGSNITDIVKTHSLSLGITAVSKSQIVLSILLIVILEIIHTIQGKGSVRQVVDRKSIVVRFSLYYTIVLAIIFLGIFDKREFIYFQF
jgi:hypothetical protein